MSLQLTVVTPEGQAFDAVVDQVVLPGAEGDFGVLEQHERFLAALRPGAVAIHRESGTEWAAVSDGFADVSSEQVVVLVNRCALAEQIDVAATEGEIARLEAELAELGPAAEAPDEAAADSRRALLERDLAAARARLEVAARR